MGWQRAFIPSYPLPDRSIGAQAEIDAAAREGAPLDLPHPSESLGRLVAVDADASPAASARFGVRGIPTVLFFRKGEAVGRVVGAVRREQLEAELRRVSATFA